VSSPSALHSAAVTAALSSSLDAVLYDVAPTDARTFIALPVLLLIVAMEAAYLPARATASADPLAALKDN